MTSVQGADGVGLYEFPAPRDVPQLGWLGPDYTSTFVSNLGAGLREQDAGTELIAVKCEAPPRLEARRRLRLVTPIVTWSDDHSAIETSAAAERPVRSRLRGRR